MTDAQGTVIALEGDEAVVRMDEAGCGRCHEKGGCGGQNLGRMFCSTSPTYRLHNPGGLRVGDRVQVAVADGAVGRAALLAYALPLLCLFAAAFVGRALAGEGGAIGGAGLGLLAGWWLFRRRQAAYPARHPHTQPHIRT